MKKLLIIFISLMLFIVITSQGSAKEEKQFPEQASKELKIILEKARHYCLELEKICKQEPDLNIVRQKTVKSMKEFAKISKEVVSYLIAEFKEQNKDWKYRYIILQVLSTVKDERVEKAIIERLKDNNDNIRAYSAWALGQQKSLIAVDPLLNSLDDNSLKVKANAAYSLGQIKDKKSIKRLREKTKDKDKITSINSIWALGEISDEDSTDLLLELFKIGDETIKINIVIALGKIKNQMAIENLRKIEESLVESEPVRALAKEILGKKNERNNYK